MNIAKRTKLTAAGVASVGLLLAMGTPSIAMADEVPDTAMTITDDTSNDKNTVDGIPGTGRAVGAADPTAAGSGSGADTKDQTNGSNGSNTTGSNTKNDQADKQKEQPADGTDGDTGNDTDKDNNKNDLTDPDKSSNDEQAAGDDEDDKIELVDEGAVFEVRPNNDTATPEVQRYPVPELPADSATWLYPDTWTPDPSEPMYGVKWQCLHCGSWYIYNGGFTGCIPCTEKAFSPKYLEEKKINIFDPSQYEEITKDMKDPVFIPIYWTDGKGNYVYNKPLQDLFPEDYAYKPYRFSSLVKSLTGDDYKDRAEARTFIWKCLFKLDMLPGDIMGHTYRIDPKYYTTTPLEWIKALYEQGLIPADYYLLPPDFTGYESVLGFYTPSVFTHFKGWSWNPDIFQAEMVLSDNQGLINKHPLPPEPEEPKVETPPAPQPEPEPAPVPAQVKTAGGIPQTGDSTDPMALFAIMAIVAMAGVIAGNRRRIA